MTSNIKNIARIYLRVSTEQKDIRDIARTAKAAGYYIAGIYREKASGARADRPELLLLIADLQEGEVWLLRRLIVLAVYR